MDFFNTKKQYNLLKTKINKAIASVHNHGKYIMGPEVIQLENLLKKYLNVKYVITCANGTDALMLSLMSINIKKGDAVFLPSFSFVSTAEAVAILGADPVFVDVDERTFNIKKESLIAAIENIKNNTDLNCKAIVSVDLFGQTSNYDELKKISQKYKLKLIADSAQSFGAKWKNKKVGNLADITTTSFFPAKPFGCYGDGGAVFTNNSRLFNKINSIRIHGSNKKKYQYSYVGINSRLDTIQASILIEKLRIFDKEIEIRNKIAKFYNKNLSKYLKIPIIDNNCRSVWAQYTLISNNRKKIINYLSKYKIPTAIYYPIPIHLQKPYQKFYKSPDGLKNSIILSKQVFSIPIYPYLSKKNQIEIISRIKETFKN